MSLNKILVMQTNVLYYMEQIGVDVMELYFILACLEFLCMFLFPSLYKIGHYLKINEVMLIIQVFILTFQILFLYFKVYCVHV